jgi:mRNA interferase RelE/StbE
MKAIAYSKDALRTLKGLPASVRQLIVSKIEVYAENPKALGNNLKPLKGRKGEFRLRVGDWHVIMTDNGAIVAIIKIGPRSSVYD